MENFETILASAEKSLNNIRGIFDNERVEFKIKELEKVSLKENFWKDKNLAKTVKQKNLEDILIPIKN